MWPIESNSFFFFTSTKRIHSCVCLLDLLLLGLPRKNDSIVHSSLNHIITIDEWFTWLDFVSALTTNMHRSAFSESHTISGTIFPNTLRPHSSVTKLFYKYFGFLYTLRLIQTSNAAKGQIYQIFLTATAQLTHLMRTRKPLTNIFTIFELATFYKLFLSFPICRLPLFVTPCLIISSYRKKNSSAARGALNAWASRRMRGR